MGYGLINIWIREPDGCCISKMNGYAWAKCCANQQIVAQTPLRNGHAELKVPPGCYIVDAAYRPGCCGTAKETVAIVNCGQTACVNLIREYAGNPVRSIVAFAAHGPKAGLTKAKVNDLVRSLRAIAKTVPKEKMAFYTDEEIALKRKVSDKTHQALLTRYKKVLTGG